jgi:hypothetical protein
MIYTLVFVAFNWAAGGYVNVSTTFSSQEKCEQALAELKTTSESTRSQTIQIAKCY